MRQLVILLVLWWNVTANELYLTVSNFIEHKDEFLYLDRCFNLTNFGFQSSSVREDWSVYHTTLQSVLASQSYSSCASCYLCHLYLKRESYTPAYILATRALLVRPQLPPALTCIAALYYRQNNILRASFYAELAFRRPFNHSKFVFYDDIGNTAHIYEHIQAEGVVRLLEQDMALCSDILSLLPEFAPLGGFLLSLKDGSSVLTAYWDNLYLLPNSLVGSGITAYEAFLDTVEECYATCKETRQLSIHGTSSRALHVYPEYVPDTQWPPEKTLLIFSYVQIDTVLKTFGENNMGLSDALNKLGVPHRIVSRSIPEDDFITILVLNIGKVYDEEYGKYVFWNFEKNPSIHDMSSAGVDAKYDVCGNDVMRYGPGYINNASGIWESVLLNMVKWPVSLQTQFVPALLPDQTIGMSKLANQFASKSIALFGAGTLDDLDEMRPIDVLFFGSSNPHRNDVYEKFQRFGEEHDWNIKFFMDYAFFGPEREIAIQQSKVVLNLANFHWPYTVTDRPVRSSVLSENYAAADICGAATNFHRIRSLLARGKVVLSERSGSTVEESLMTDFVTFADTDDLVNVALLLLSDPMRRHHLEERAVRYMLEDHSQGSVRASGGTRASSLALLGQAVTELAGNMWNYPVASAHSFSRPVTRAENAMQYLSKYLEELELQEKDSLHPDAALDWAEITCMLSGHEDDSSSLQLQLESGLVGVTNNASNACHKKSNLSILLGYLSRRYQFRGNCLMVGYTSKREALDTLRHTSGCRDVQLSVFPSQFDAALDIINAHLAVSSVQYYDMIVINQELMHFGFDELQQVLLTCLRRLQASTGSLVINHMLPLRHHVEEVPSQAYDAWKLLADVRQHSFFDAAVANFDNGLLLVSVRDNPFVSSVQFFLERPKSYFLRFIDRVIPVLTLSEVHTWLSNSSGTRRFVRSFKKS